MILIYLEEQEDTEINKAPHGLNNEENDNVEGI